MHTEGAAVARGGDPAELLRVLLQAVSDISPCDCASVWLTESRQLVLSTTTDVHGAESSIARGANTLAAALADAALGVGHRGVSDRQKTTAYSAELSSALSGFGIRAVDTLPLRSRDGEALGVLALWYGDAISVPRPQPSLIGLLVRHVADFLHCRRSWSEVTAQLAHAEQRAAAATAGMRRRDEFLAMLSHELRQPLAAAVPAIEVQQRSHNPEHRQRATQVIEHQLRQLTRLIDDLSDLSHIHRGSLVLRRQRADLREMLRDALDTTAALASAKKHRRTVDLGARPAWALVDVGRMTQVFSNLLRNAVVYTPEGGSIDVALAAGEDTIELRVRDSGIGILAGDLERIFKPFERAARRRDSSGLGVGLAIVRQIVEMHGGWVSAASDGRDCGSEFVVSLPIDDGTTAPEAPPADAS